MNAMGQSNEPSSYQPNFNQNPQPQQPVQEPVQQQAQDPGQAAGQQPVDSTAKLIEMKKLLDAGVITEEEFKKIRFDLLGI